MLLRTSVLGTRTPSKGGQLRGVRTNRTIQSSIIVENERVSLTTSLFSQPLSTKLQTASINQARDWKPRKDQSLRNEQRTGSNIGTFIRNLSSLVNEGQLEEAENQYLAKKGEIAFPNVVYNIMIKGYGRAQNLRKVQETLDEMKKAGVKPDVVTYTTLMKIYDTAEQSNKVVRYFEELVQTGLSLDARTWTILLASIVKRQNPVLGRKYIDDFEKAGVVPNIGVCRSIVYLAPLMGDHELARKYLDEGKRIIKSRNFLPEENLGALGAFYISAIDGYTDAKDPDRVMQLATEAEKDGVEPSAKTYNCLVRAAIGAGDLKKAEQYVNTMLQKGHKLNPTIHSQFMTYWGNQGDLEKMEEIFHRAIKETPQNSIIYNVLLHKTAKILADATNKGAEKVLRDKLVQKVNTILEQMEESGVVVMATYVGLFHQYARGGLYKEARETVDRMFQRGFVNVDRRVFKEIAELFVEKQKDPDGLLSWVNSIKARGKEKYEIDRKKVTLTASHWINLLWVLGTNGHINHMFQLLDMMTADRIRPTATIYTIFIKALSEAGDKERVKDFHNRLKGIGGEINDQIFKNPWKRELPDQEQK